MGWNKKSNCFPNGQSNWDNFVQKSSNVTAEEAMRIAFANPKITFFFVCRESVNLDDSPASKYGPFEARDTVFFTGEPLYGDAPQCDAYEKTPISTVYINPRNNQQFQEIDTYVLKDGSPAIDVVCIFAGNYATNTIPMLRANNNVPPTTEPFNKGIENVLSSGFVRILQSKGITVLLTIMGAHTQTGWSQFSDQSTAQNFVNYLKSNVVTPYGLDGIDIDDEYGYGPVTNYSLAMVTTLMKQSMPDKLITKALSGDTEYFGTKWNGNSLGANLDYGWEMTYYGGDANSRLSIYTSYMGKKQLCLGFSAEEMFSPKQNQVQPQAAKTISDGYGGAMMFAYENQPHSLTLMQDMVNGMDGPGNWNKIPTENLKHETISNKNSALEAENEVKSRNCCTIV